LSVSESSGWRSPSITRTRLYGFIDRYRLCMAGEILSYGWVTRLVKGPAFSLYR
jgi:hypothetical protein